MNSSFFSILQFVALVIMVTVPPVSAQDKKQNRIISDSSTAPIALAIHGGAGTILRSAMTPETETLYRRTLTEALQAGYAVLKRGGTSLDAVSAAIVIMEDSPLFNAGKGAVFTADSTNEMDAAIMDGKTRKAGAVTGVRGIKNPVVLARLVMDKSEHVMLSGAGAERFAETQGMKKVPASYFFTERRWKEFLQVQAEDAAATSPAVRAPQETPATPGTQQKRPKKASSRLEAIPALDIPAIIVPEKKFGTVGAVALDKAGNLAAATSTGGMTNKKYGRVGDCPIIGAGTYANNATCAVSATGHGEYFIRSVVAHDIASMMEYGKMTVRDAAETVVMKKLVEFGGSGGVIAMDKAGTIAMPFNSEGMYRGCIMRDGTVVVEIFRTESK
jgi:L-asparaginase / beta-aspartyl-peptidase